MPTLGRAIAPDHWGLRQGLFIGMEAFLIQVSCSCPGCAVVSEGATLPASGTLIPNNNRLGAGNGLSPVVINLKTPCLWPLGY